VRLVLVAGALANAIAGLLFGLSLIVAIGAQNTFVLRQGIQRVHVPTVVAICGASDVILIAAGVAGGGALLGHHQGLLLAARVVGATFLLGYGGLAARRSIKPGRGLEDGSTAATSWGAVAAACLAFTWLNPAVYLDTVVLLGSVANARPGRQWWFGGGAALASILWFAALGFGAGLLGPVFRRPGAWRVLDGGVAVVMVLTAGRVLAGG
jgi:L-lysine exporter family protein LysE/ArgO